jgi:hypothetical protein
VGGGEIAYRIARVGRRRVGGWSQDQRMERRPWQNAGFASRKGCIKRLKPVPPRPRGSSHARLFYVF